MYWEDGKGTGLKAGVDGANRGLVFASTVTELEEINEDEGQVFDIPLDAVAPSGATFFWVLQNNGQTTYSLYRFNLASSAAGVFRLSKISITTLAGGTAVSANGLNLGKVVTLDNVTLQTGASITGVTEVNPLRLLYLQANNMVIADIESRIWLPPGSAIALRAPGAATVNGDLQIYREG